MTMGTDVLGRAEAGLARLYADRALEIATQLWAEDPHGGATQHAVAADDAAFLAKAAAGRGRRAEVQDLLRTARCEYRTVRRMARAMLRRRPTL